MSTAFTLSPAANAMGVPRDTAITKRIHLVMVFEFMSAPDTPPGGGLNNPPFFGTNLTM